VRRNVRTTVKRKHHALHGELTVLLDAFDLKMEDVREKVPYLVNNALRLPNHLTSKEIRQIGLSACLSDHSGFSLGDILAWVQKHPDPAISYKAFRRMVFDTGLSQRTADYNYKSLSKTFPADARHPSLSRPHHDAVRSLPRPEQQRLLREAFDSGWSDLELRKRAQIRKQELARSAIELCQSRNARIVDLLSKPSLTAEDAAVLARESAALFTEMDEVRNLLLALRPAKARA
jgi:hypothetical protein